MNTKENDNKSVTLRPKGNKTGQKLSKEPEFIDLAGMVGRGQVSGVRLQDYIRKEQNKDADHE